MSMENIQKQDQVRKISINKEIAEENVIKKVKKGIKTGKKIEAINAIVHIQFGGE